MADFKVANHILRPVEGDEQLELIIESTDGAKWEYGIPYSPTTGRYQFEEIDVIAMDFGEDFSQQLTEELDELVARLVAERG
jgi:hypothetical protein